MKKVFAFALVSAFALGGGVGALALLPLNPDSEISTLISPRPVWTEVSWPFAVDQWGRGRAFQCKPAHCGAEVEIYLRAKLGSCNCATGIADDGELDRMGDLALVGGEVLPLRAGSPIMTGWMKGRTRTYALTARRSPHRTAISVVFNDRCDMIVATAVLPRDRLATIEPFVLEFLNSGPVLRWAEVTLGT